MNGRPHMTSLQGELSALAMPETSSRLHFVGPIRIFLIALVVAQHSAEAYVSTGGNWMVNDPVKSGALLPLFIWNGTFFMGFFFLISGYFLEASIARNGLRGAVLSRVLRLGLPLLIFVVLVNGLIGYLMTGSEASYPEFVLRTYLLGGNAEFGPLWFIAHLLLYVLIYAALRALLIGAGPFPLKVPAPGPGQVLAFAFVLGIVTLLIRIRYPIDDWIRLFGLVRAEPARMPQYVSLFLIGIVAGQNDWFTKIGTRMATAWFLAGLAIFAVMTAWAAPRLVVPDDMGLRLAWGFLEAFVGTGTILGLLVFFRARFANPSRLARTLEGNVYGVYLIHVYAVIGLQAALRPLPWPAEAKFLAVWAGAIAISFALTALARLVPAVRRIV